MKKHLFSILLIAFALSGYAQQDGFAPLGAEWYFNLSSFMGSPYGYYRMSVVGDTLIHSRERLQHHYAAIFGW